MNGKILLLCICVDSYKVRDKGIASNVVFEWVVLPQFRQ